MRIFDDTDPGPPVAINRVISDVSVRGQADTNPSTLIVAYCVSYYAGNDPARRPRARMPISPMVRRLIGDQYHRGEGCQSGDIAKCKGILGMDL